MSPLVVGDHHRSQKHSLIAPVGLAIDLMGWSRLQIKRQQAIPAIARQFQCPAPTPHDWRVCDSQAPPVTSRLKSDPARRSPGLDIDQVVGRGGEVRELAEEVIPPGIASAVIADGLFDAQLTEQAFCEEGPVACPIRQQAWIERLLSQIILMMEEDRFV